MFSSRRAVSLLMVSVTAVLVSSCTFLDSFVPKDGETTDVLDRQKNLTLNDFRALSEIDKSKEGKEEIKTTVKLGAPPLPDIAQVLAAPKPPKIANTKLVTLAVTDDVPLRDVLFELGRLANVDIEVGSGLDKKGINLRATDRPFNEVIERIATLAHLRYSSTGNSIRVERDLPYLKNYSLDFLNIVRSSTSNYNVNTNVLGAGGGAAGGGGGAAGGAAGGAGGAAGGAGGAAGGAGGGIMVQQIGSGRSASTITSTAESDLWSSLEASITEILTQNPGDVDELIGDANNPAAQQVGAAGAVGQANTRFVINRQSGVLSVTATQAQHEVVQRYLILMTRNASAQVLIEAKIVEVSLADEFLSGVNWTEILGDAVGKSQNFIGIGNYPKPTPVGGNAGITLGLRQNDLSAVLTAVQRFGTVRTLSSPRLSAINNQQAVLTVATNRVFFDCMVAQGATTINQAVGNNLQQAPSVQCTTQSVPIGIILNIIPSINLDSQEVTLNVRPTLTRETAEVENPGIRITAAAVGLTDFRGFVPVIEVREMDSIMKVKSGDVMVIGGLMQDSSRNSFIGVPGAQEIPILGNLFKSRNEASTKQELIIFIKATIVNSDGSSGPADRAVYDKFITDPRQLFPKE